MGSEQNSWCQVTCSWAAGAPWAVMGGVSSSSVPCCSPGFIGCLMVPCMVAGSGCWLLVKSQMAFAGSPQVCVISGSDWCSLWGCGQQLLAPCVHDSGQQLLALPFKIYRPLQQGQHSWRDYSSSWLPGYVRTFSQLLKVLWGLTAPPSDTHIHITHPHTPLLLPHSLTLCHPPGCHLGIQAL